MNDLITFEKYIELKNILSQFIKSYERKKFISNRENITEIILYAFGFISQEYELVKEVIRLIDNINNYNLNIKQNELIKKGETIDEVYVKDVSVKDYEKIIKMIDECKIKLNNLFLIVDNSGFVYKIFKIERNEIKYVSKDIVFFGGDNSSFVGKLKKEDGIIYFHEYYYVPYNFVVNEYVYEIKNTLHESYRRKIPEEVVKTFFDEEYLI